MKRVLGLALLGFLGFGMGSALAGEAQLFIDPQDPTQVWQVQIPYEAQVVLSVQVLPTSSPWHEDVAFGEQHFSHIVLSPDRAILAFSVDGTHHDWSGVYSLADQKLKPLGICFEGQVHQTFWSTDGRYLAVEEMQASNRQFLEVFDLEEGASCRLDGRRAKNKYLNFSKPWWDPQGEKIYFKVDYNNVYRQSLGLKRKKIPSRIGEAGPNCKNIVFYSVAEFMKKFPQDSPYQTSEAVPEN